MKLDKASYDTLRYLFQEYQKAPSVMYSINKITDRYGVDAVELSDALVEHHLIRERWIYPDDVVTCRITIRGMEQVDPLYVDTQLRMLIGGLEDAGGSRELGDILENKLEQYALALDLVQQLDSMGLVEILHPRNAIIIRLTEEGRRFYQKRGSSLFTLMAY